MIVPKKILLADDTPEELELLRVFVSENSNAELLIAKDGIEAEQLFQEHADTIVLAILDNMMPYKRGIIVCLHIKEAHPHIPVLIHTSAWKNDSFMRSAKIASVNAVIPKRKYEAIKPYLDELS